MMTISERQAYAAMFLFLDEIWERTKSDELGGLLGGMSLLEDGSSADPAYMLEWKSAVARVVSGEDAGKLELR